MSTLISFFALAAFLSPAPGAAQPREQQSRQARHEGTSGSAAIMRAVFDSWDENGDGRLNRSEFVSGFKGQQWLQSADRDGDFSLSEDEFEAQMRGMHLYERADLDADGVVEPSEARRLLRGAAPSEWDDNGAPLGEDELSDALFRSWDENGDGFLSESELASDVFIYADEDEDGWVTPEEFEESAAFIF